MKDIEEELRDYMREMRELDLHKTLRDLVDAQMEHQRSDDVFQAEVRGEFRGLSMRVTKLEEKDRALEDSDKDLAAKLENSGLWTREQLVAEKKKLEAMLWKIIWAVAGAVLGAIGAALSRLIH